MGLIGNLKRDWTTLSGLRTLLANGKDITPDSLNIAADDLEASVDKHKANVAFRFEGEIMTYGELDKLANRVANWGLAQGYKAGDAVALDRRAVEREREPQDGEDQEDLAGQAESPGQP